MRFQLLLTVDVDTSNNDENAEQIMHENLTQLVNYAVINGMLTTDSNLLVDDYNFDVTTCFMEEPK